MTTSLRISLLVAFALFASSTASNARPGWADKVDSKTDDGHSFVCEGEGKTEEDALAAAQAICNDKICKVCGVEVESVTTTNETLKGVDLQRKVVERCRRVRKSDTQVKRKSADCEEQSCDAWIEVFYSSADEKAECPAYTKDDFADPALCEQDIDAFRNVKDRSADSFRERTRDLDAAILHCARIDVRPTPALLALDNKLHAGMDAFEFNEAMQRATMEESGANDPFETGYMSKREAMMENRPFWAWYLTTDPELRRSIDESKLLAQRLQLIRDYVANRALVFDVAEAASAHDLDSPAGIERLRGALERAPLGGQYGSKDIHFSTLSAFYHPKSDTSPVAALMRKLYDPKALPPEGAWTLALLFAGDGKCTDEEWNYIFASEQSHLCVECMRVLLEARDHGSPETRLARFDQAYALVAPQLHGKGAEMHALTNLVGHNSASLLTAAMARVPPQVLPQLTWEFLRSAIDALDPKRNTPEEGAALLARVVTLVGIEVDKADPKDRESECSSLADKLPILEKQSADTRPLEPSACSCLAGPLRNELSLVNRDDLLKWADKRKLACTKGLPRQPQ